VMMMDQIRDSKIKNEEHEKRKSRTIRYCLLFSFS